MAIGTAPTNGAGLGEAFVHSVASTSGSGVLAGAPNNGDTLILLATAGANTQALTAVSQTGVTWFRLGVSLVTWSAEVWLGIVGAGASATVNITSLVNGSVSQMRWNVSVWTGSPRVRVASGSSVGAATTTITGASVAHPTNGSDAVVLVSARSFGAISAPGGSFTALTSGSTGTGFAYQKVSSTTGSYQVSYTQTSGAYETMTVILSAPTTAQAAAVSANATLVAATGTDSAWPAIYDRRMNTTVISSLVSAWEDVRFGSATTNGPQLAQATAGSRPGFSGTWGAGTELVTLSSASTQHLTSAATSALQLAPTTALYAVAIYEATGTGPIAGAAADPTSSTTYPYALLQGGGSNHKGDFAPEGVTTGRIQPDSGVAFADTTARLAAIGHSIPVANNSASDVVWRYWFGGRQVRRHHGVTTATAGNLKISVGRIGSTYGNGKLHWLGFTTQDLTATQWQALLAFASAQFGATADTSKRNTLVFVGDSLEYGSQSTDPMTAAVASGTKTPSYVCANTNSGARGTLATQGLDVGDVHAYDYGVSGRTLQVIVDEFAREVAPNIDGQRTGPKVLWIRGIGNYVQNSNATIAQLRTVATTLYSTALAAGFTEVVWETELDRGAGSNGTNANATGWYVDNTWAALSANGTVVTTFNGDLRTSLATYGTRMNDMEANAAFTINRAVSRAMLDATYYNADKTHLTDVGYALVGTTRKTFLDSNDTVFWLSAQRPRRRRR